MNLLLVHGNGGASSRFRLFLDRLNRTHSPEIRAFVPELPGFEGRPLPAGPIGWETFLQPIQDLLESRAQEEWVLYGHGIGGSILLEWVSREYSLGKGLLKKPKKIILHAPIGASLSHRWFPKVMKVKIIRKIIHWLIYQRWLQRSWEKKLFLDPDAIPTELRRQFFADYRSCRAFPHFFDLIDQAWYQQIQKKLQDQSFYFLWGEEERVVASQFVHYWQEDFPRSTFELIPGWDHFPMLEQADAFFHKIVQMIGDRPTSDHL